MLGQFWGEGYALVHSELVCKLQPSLSPQWIIKQTFFVTPRILLLKRKYCEVIKWYSICTKCYLCRADAKTGGQTWGDSGGHNANIGGHNAKCHYGTSASVVLGSWPEEAEQRILLPRFQGINHTGITLPRARTEEFKVVNSRSENERKG